MRIALLGDVHANLPALEAVLGHAAQQKCGAIWNVGDIVGYGAFPNQVIRALRKAQAISIAGNYDLKVLSFPEKRSRWRKSKRPEKYFAFQWAYRQLTRANRRYLSKLPQERRMKVAGRRVLLTHGSPASNEEPLTPDTPEERLVELVEIARAEVIICGHSHQPFSRRIGNAWLINTGSVGRPDDGDPRACYAILELNHERVAVQHFRLEYDVLRAVAEVRKQDLPEVFAQMLIRGCELNMVSEDSDAESAAEAGGSAVGE